jgi:hypothetical protein
MIKAPASLAKRRTTPAISYVLQSPTQLMCNTVSFPGLLRGTVLLIALVNGASVSLISTIPDGKIPGAIQFTRMPKGISFADNIEVR